ncbi:MAG: Crp/Fnr family transcriptional regulator [Caulobacteraceae bacterium]|nr:Crp/Fnr family transcriptional regulator [Caulobacteraceae bacterium]
MVELADISKEGSTRSAHGVSEVDGVVRALGAGSLFHLLPAQFLRRMASRGRPLALQRGAMLAQAGDAGDAVYVLLEGEIEVLRRSPGGREVRMAALGGGEVVGEMAALDGGVRSADMIATRPCRLWRIPRDALIDAFEEEPRASIALLAELSRRLRASNDALEAHAVLDLAGRLALLLLHERGRNGLVALTQTEMARRLSASRERVNRKLHEWVAEGWVELAAAGVRVAEPEALGRLTRKDG